MNNNLPSLPNTIYSITSLQFQVMLYYFEFTIYHFAIYGAIGKIIMHKRFRWNLNNYVYLPVFQAADSNAYQAETND